MLSVLLVIVFVCSNAHELENEGDSPISTNGTTQYNITWESSVPMGKFSLPSDSIPNAFEIIAQDKPQDTRFNITLRIIPGKSGQVLLYETYPNGQTYIIDAVQEVSAGNWYIIRLKGDEPGTYMIWYSINGIPSNKVSFKVGEESEQGVIWSYPPCRSGPGCYPSKFR